MEQRGIGIGALGVGGAAVLGWLFRGTLSPAPFPGQAGAASSAASAQGGGGDAARWTAHVPSGSELLREYFRSPSGIGNACLNILIATIPDPADSHLDWAFDTDLAAMRRAFEQAGYVTDRFWLPWAADRYLARAYPRADTSHLRRESPGLILFRHLYDESLALLYLVGEVPTSGVHKKALTAALDERALLLNQAIAPCQKGPDTIRVIGPTFSGSAASLRMVFSGRRESAHIKLVSGGATAASNFLLNSGRVTFRTTVNSDQVLLVALDSLLRQLGIDARQVALLRESSTQYGSEAGSASPDYVNLTFPMSISSLRTEYARTLAGQSVNGVPGQAPLPRIPLNLQDPTSPTENPPVLSDLTAPVLDLVLDEALRTLVERRVRAVVLLATDDRDKLFLGAEIRRRAPDVQILTFGGNALFLRPDYNTSLRGMLVVSTYPLSTRNHPHSAISPFPNELAQGRYNATLVQLGLEEAMLDYGDPLAGDALRPPVWITAVGRHGFLPVRTFTVTTPDLRYMEEAPRPPPAEVTRGRISPLIVGFVVALTGALGWLARRYVRRWVRYGRSVWRAVRYWKKARRADPEARQPGWLSRIAIIIRTPVSNWWRRVRHRGRADADTLQGASSPVPWVLESRVWSASLRLHRELYSVLGLLAAGSALGPLAVVFLRASEVDLSSPLKTGLWIAAAFWAASAASGTVLAVKIIVENREIAVQYALAKWRSVGDRMIWLVEVVARVSVVGIGLLYAGITAAFVVEANGLDDMFFIRAARMNDGVSPIPTLVLGALGFGSWCVWHLRRVRALRKTTVFEAAFTISDAAPVPDLRKRIRTIRRKFFLILPDGTAVAVFLFLVMTGVLVALRLDTSLEATVFDEIFSIRYPVERGYTAFDLILGFSVVAAVTTSGWALYRFLSVWHSLKRLLDGLAACGLFAALKRLPEGLGGLTRLTVSGDASPYALPALARSRWSHLQRIHAPASHKLDADLNEEIARLLAGPFDTRRSDSLFEHPGNTRLADLYKVVRRLQAVEPTDEDIKALVEKKEAVDAKPIGAVERLHHGLGDPVRLWLRTAEEFIAVQVVDYLEWVFSLLRNLALFLLISLLLALMLLTSYPYHPVSATNMLFLGVLVAAVASVLTVLVQADRDRILSAITRSEPGHVIWDSTFVWNAIIFGALPLLTAAGSVVPEVRDFFSSWSDPLLRALTKQ